MALGEGGIIVPWYHGSRDLGCQRAVVLVVV